MDCARKGGELLAQRPNDFAETTVREGAEAFFGDYGRHLA